MCLTISLISDGEATLGKGNFSVLSHFLTSGDGAKFEISHKRVYCKYRNELRTWSAAVTDYSQIRSVYELNRNNSMCGELKHDIIKNSFRIKLGQSDDFKVFEGFVTHPRTVYFELKYQLNKWVDSLPKKVRDKKFGVFLPPPLPAILDQNLLSMVSEYLYLGNLDFEMDTYSSNPTIYEARMIGDSRYAKVYSGYSVSEVIEKIRHDDSIPYALKPPCSIM